MFNSNCIFSKKNSKYFYDFYILNTIEVLVPGVSIDLLNNDITLILCNITIAHLCIISSNNLCVHSRPLWDQAVLGT